MKNNDHVAAIQQANAVKAITTRHETLKRDICKKARELAGPDREEELQCFCRVHEALCNLQRQVITYRMTIDPILKTRSGTMERLGVGLVDKVLKKIDVMKLKRRVAAYDKAVEHYINKFASAQPPEMAKSVQEVLGKKPDNPFCSDILFETRDAAWANDRTCQHKGPPNG